MGVREQLERRKKAREGIHAVFEDRRDRVASWPDRTIRQRFLAELNGLARELERKAMDLAEKGGSWEKVKVEAERELEKLKERFVERLGGDDPVASAPNAELIEAIRRL